MGVVLIPNLSESHISRIVKETNCLLSHVRVTFKYMEKKMISKLFMSYMMPKLIFLKEAQRAYREGLEENNRR